ncbi:MAG: outer membrane protein assembly factor BamD [Immundisolibacteraceae bacterium]|nr:outer membrane protein assembly factor BamD [Immundisolibacteraceae bacterium]
MRLLRSWSLLPLMALLVVGCSGDVQVEDETVNWSPMELYDQAREYLLDGGFTPAVDHYEKLIARYPYGPYAEQARMDLAYAYFRDNQPEAALDSIDRFIKLYPLHDRVDYLYYIRGLVHFRRDVSVFERMMPQDASAREVASARKAFDSFLLLLQLHPDSDYADDARQRMVYLRNRLAGHEIHVANYYMKRGAYVAVNGRARHVLETFPGTPAIPEALALLVKSYRLLGQDSLASDSMRLLELNYPEHGATLEAQAFVVN